MSGEITLRSARVGDAAGCVAVLSGWIEETPWMPRLHSDASMLAFWRGRIAECPAWVAEREGEILGFCLRDGVYVTALYLSPAARGGGLGRDLLERARAGQPRVRLWCFEANDRARRFYAAAGFREVRRTGGDNEEGLPDIELEWSATPKERA